MSLFNEALSKGSAEERDAFLTAACAGDEALRGQVKALLEANAQAANFLSEPTRVVRPEQPRDEGPGTVVGRYKLLQVFTFMFETFRSRSRRLWIPMHTGLLRAKSL